jgi:hypothetical protein
VLDLCDTAAYLRISPEMYEFALAADLRLVAFADGKTLFTVPLKRLGPQQAHLSERLGAGVRRLPFDLRGALAVHGGVARHGELALAGPTSHSDAEFVRSVGVFDLLAAGSSATPDLLQEVGVDGGLETLEDGSLTGWFRPRAYRSGEAISLYIDGELIASRAPSLHRSDVPEDDRTRGFSFNISNLLRIRYANQAEISVRVSGTNIPLRGAPLTVTDVTCDLSYDAARDAWVTAPRPSQRRPVLERVRRRLGKR